MKYIICSKCSNIREIVYKDDYKIIISCQKCKKHINDNESNGDDGNGIEDETQII